MRRLASAIPQRLQGAQAVLCLRNANEPNERRAAERQRRGARAACRGILLPLQASLIWKAARTIDAKPAPLVLTVLGPGVMGLAGGVPGLQSATGSLSLAIGAAYTLATATTLWLARKERLAARFPLVILSAVHAVALLIGTSSTLNGSRRSTVDHEPVWIYLF